MSGRTRAILVVIVIGLFALLLSVRGIANFVTDYLWFDAIGYEGVWSRVLLSRIILAVIFIVLFFVLCWVNLWLADRLAPELRDPSPEEEAVARFREVVGKRWGLVRIGVSLLFAISIGASAAAQWRNWMLFTNFQEFGQTDPQFGRDIGFYVFRMPFLTWLAGWLFTALVVVLILTLAMHYLAGGIRIQSVEDRVTSQVKVHVSVLLAAMAAVRAVSYYLDRFALAYSTDGRFAGLSYTDVNARLPVLNLLILIALLSVVLFVVNIRRRGWGLPAVAVGLWALVSIIMGGIYPLVVQRLSVNPDETSREAQFVGRNIEATKQAYGLDAINARTFDYSEALTGTDLQGNSDNVAAVPLLDPKLATQTWELQQVERSFFQFNNEDIDVDRYVIDGELTQVLIGARELNSAGIPESGWESEVLSFTHGNGVAIAPANDVEATVPVFLVGDVPVDNRIEDDLPIEQPRLYYGDEMGGYAIVDTDRDEVDSIEGGTRIPYNYTGQGGVDAGGFWRRAMFSLRFQSIDPLISDFVRDDSRFVWNRNVRERVSKVAPFLEFDHDAYPVVVDGGIKWVIDAYTTTTFYPYSQPRNSAGLDGRSDLRGGFNYVRNSVKAVVDAYDGTVELYIVDDTDPIVRAWQQAFPGVLLERSEMPDALIDNLRYPEDIFTVQTNMWAVYHIDVDETDDLLEGSDEWAIAQDPGGIQGASVTNTRNAAGEIISSSEARVQPYYSLLRLPEENQLEFVVFRSFVPFSNDDSTKELQAFMAGVSDFNDENYGRLVSYEVNNVEGDEEAQSPALVAAQISSQREISAEFTLLTNDGGGSTVEFGDLVILPIELPSASEESAEADVVNNTVQGSVLYIRPLYVIADRTEEPNLERVIVSYGDAVVMCPSVSDAMLALFGAEVPGAQIDSERQRGAEDEQDNCIGDIPSRAQLAALSGGATSTSTSTSSSSSNLPATLPEIGDGDAVTEAIVLLDQADEALLAGDLGRYQDLVDQASQLLKAVQDAASADAAETAADEGDG